MSDPKDALEYHSNGRPGKIEVIATKPLQTQRHLSMAYTPGVAEVCLAIHEDPKQAYRYTAKGNLVAVVTNGTAVLGLGNIGGLAGKPVMEGKANLFKKFADIDVFDIELNAPTADEVVAAVAAMAPTFGGINLEDIKAPECFEIEERLRAMLDIPVFHDDQHGTAIICSAALLNALQLSNKKIGEVRVVFSGAGAAAMACARLFNSLGAQADNISMYDLKGLVTTDRDDLSEIQKTFAKESGPVTLAGALEGADIFVGLSAGNILKPEMLQSMAQSPIIFAMANPTPEIAYDLAKSARPDAIVATGRSDYPNQVNNVLCFPFLFRGALDCRATKITPEMIHAAVTALAELARTDVPSKVLEAYGLKHLEYGTEYIIPKPFDPRALYHVAPAVAAAAAACGVAAEPIVDLDAYQEQLRRFVARSRGLMQPLIEECKHAKHTPKIAFPDGTNPTVLRAARLLADDKICHPILLGSPESIAELAEEVGCSLDGIELMSAMSNERIPELGEALWKLRQRKGLTLPAARSLIRQNTWLAMMLLQQREVGGVVGGLGRPYKLTVSPAIQALGVADGSKIASGIYAMMFKDRLVFLGDCTVNVNPTAAQLADIAINTARVAKRFGVEPRVAMLSYSDFGEHRDDSTVRRVEDAVRLVRELAPGLIIDGEMQADTAIDDVKRAKNFPFSVLTRAANVLIFPELTSGNIAYKLLTKLSDCEALGPLLEGLAQPVGVLPVEASVDEVVNIATYVAAQAIEHQALAKKSL